MFFMMGITDGRRDLEFSQLAVCKACGAYGRYSVFMTYTVLSLFFIPCFKWNRKYFVQSSCCGSMLRLRDDIGRRIADGEEVEILPEHLEEVNRQNYSCKRCANCGYSTGEDFDFCPKCGNHL